MDKKIFIKMKMPEKEAKVYYEEGKVTVSEMIKTIGNVGHYIALILQQD